ncbi:stage II sporulation protein M [Neolewinella litorea]|uniref:Stage II sporulation protein M n=1 Tax=Neolewinella litorea TaxID=2562452 RepID=A0A4S4NGC0_9BACT|nr:stage II sporulation protein M [Neolewinella litorea]THH37865.1 stage II sporulation protein M [Neolewinella litorea]
MRETDFIGKNQDKWERYEESLQRSDQDPARLGELYVHTTDDLSISRTFYPNRTVRVYLNGLARRTFLQLYRGRGGGLRSFLTFWSDDLPRAVYDYRRYLLLALLTFSLALLIGVVGYRIDPAFAETILGADYVRMTEANIADGDPMAVYRSRNPAGAALHITLNNLQVALLTFLAGAFLGVGSIVMLIRTGVMIGVFQYFFFARGNLAVASDGSGPDWLLRSLSWILTAGGAGLEKVQGLLSFVVQDASVFRESLLTIWIHGALEVSSFVLAGGAGLAMGGGLLFPGTLTRLQSFGRAARAGVKIMLGTVPLFVIAGLLEGFVTRQTDLPAALRLGFILFCFAFIVWYYVIYPRSVARTPRPERAILSEEGRPAPVIRLRQIRSLGEQLTVTFTICRRGTGGLLGGVLALAFGYCLLSFAFAPDAAGRYRFAGYLFAELENFHALTASYGLGRDWSFSGLVAVGLYGLVHLGLGAAARHTDLVLPPASWRREGRLLACCGLLAVTLAYSGKVVALLTFLTFPYLLMAAIGTYTEGLSPGRLFRMVYTNLAHSYGVVLMLLLIALPAGFILDSVLGQFFFAFLDWVIYTDGSTVDARNVMLQAFCYYSLFALLFCGWVIALTLSLGSLREIRTAGELKQRVAELGRRSRGEAADRE